MTARLRMQPRSHAPRCFSPDTPLPGLFRGACSDASRCDWGAPQCASSPLPFVQYEIIFKITWCRSKVIAERIIFSTGLSHRYPDAVLYCFVNYWSTGSVRPNTNTKHGHLTRWEWDSAINYLKTGTSKQTTILNLLIRSDFIFSRLACYAYVFIM